MLRKLKGFLLVGIGYMLSPLSWWNDLFFNLPIAYLFGYLVSWISPDLFIPFTIIGYWISNILGILMMQIGATDMFFEQKSRNTKRDLLLTSPSFEKTGILSSCHSVVGHTHCVTLFAYDKTFSDY